MLTEQLGEVVAHDPQLTQGSNVYRYEHEAVPHHAHKLAQAGLDTLPVVQRQNRYGSIDGLVSQGSCSTGAWMSLEAPQCC